jgi:hypothetical protein
MLLSSFRRQICALVIATLLFPGAHLCASAQDHPAEEPALLAKSLDATDIRSPGSPPFVLIAKVHMQDGGKSVDGQYATSWAEPAKFRRILSFPNFTETDVATGDFIFKKRSMEGLPLLVWQANRMMDSFFKHQLNPKSKIKKAFTEQANGVTLNCMVLEEKEVDSKVCFQPDTAGPVSLDVEVNRFSAFQEHYQFRDYQPFEGKRFPRSILFTGWGSRSIEIKVEKLLRVQAFAAKEFTPLPESARFVVCANESASVGDGDFGLGKISGSGFRNIKAAIYLEIGPNGAARYGEVVYSSSPLDNKEVLQWYLDSPFPVRSCDGKPIAYEIMVRLSGEH